MVKFAYFKKRPPLLKECLRGFALASATLSIASELHSDIAKRAVPPASCSMRT